MEKLLSAVICVLNSQYIHSSLAPWCLLAGADSYCKSGINVKVTEGTINEKIENVASRIIKQNPKVIGFSCYIWNITETIELLTLIKSKLPNAVIILGGPEVSYNAEEILKKHELVDYVISGEGEKPFALLLNAIYKNTDIKNIPGICYRNKEKIIVSPPNTPTEEPPSPYTQKYFDSLKGRIAYLETSRGCPYSCAFCLSGRCGSVRFFDLERAKKELLLLANSGTKTVKLVDRTFNANKKRANELYKFIIENYGKNIPDGACFHFEIAGDILDDEMLDILSKAPVGAMQLEIGLQSFNPVTLQAINRKTNVERLKKNIRGLVKNANMHIHIDLIAGLPYEDLQSFKKSFNIAYSLKPNMLQLGFLKLLYGAPMREEHEKYPCTYSNTPPYEVIETPWITNEELSALHYAEDALERLYNSGRFLNTLQYIFKQTECSPFELFDKFGRFSAENGTAKISLDDYTALIFGYFKNIKGIDKVRLRDIMVCDRLTTNASGKLPPVLKVKDPELKNQIRKFELENSKPSKGLKRGYAILYSENTLVYVDYKNRNPITGKYTLFKHRI